ncbi:MAG: hypothetical protein PVJ98_02505 [Akkermansiaceae bacterium]|jgi:hypothetical protein
MGNQDESVAVQAEPKNAHTTESVTRVGKLRMVTEEGDTLGTFAAERLQREKGDFWVRIDRGDLKLFLEITTEVIGKPVDFFWNGDFVVRGTLREKIPSGILPLIDTGNILTTDDWDEAVEHLLEPFSR